MRASAYLAEGGPLAATMAEYEPRPGQMSMADAVQKTLEQDGVLLVEAGTGTGKTLAYLIPAMLSDRKVVISTGTKTLQDQIMEQDIPLLKRHVEPATDREIRVASMKGLQNYLCLRRFEEYQLSAQSIATNESASSQLMSAQLATLKAWRQRTTSGDRAELPLEDNAELWSHVMSGSDTRIGPRCTFHEACFVTKMRQAAADADIVVVNHHLFFADLAMRGPHGASVIPDYDAVIFDEAHQIEDVATMFFGVQVTSSKIDRLIRDAERVLALMRSSHALRAPSQVAHRAATFFSSLPRSADARLELDPSVFDQGSPRQSAASPRQAWFDFDAALEDLAHCLDTFAERSDTAAQVARRAERIRDDVASIVDREATRQVAWTEQRGRSLSLGASPIQVADTMRDELFFRVPSVVLTSATLSVGGSDFSFLRRRLGLAHTAEEFTPDEFATEELTVPSPFDYAEQAALYLPPSMPDPRAADFVDAAAEQVRALVELTGGGAWVLCTSIRSKNALAKRCHAQLGDSLLKQGDAPNRVLLERFRNDPRSVLFGTASFWEGVDVPGDALRLVIIDKLPFEAPSDPLTAARCAHLERQGESPFKTYLLPSAALTLKQGFGRLIRSRRDRGIVAILDSRIIKRGYGAVFLRSLPDARRCSTLEEAAAFWNSV